MTRLAGLGLVAKLARRVGGVRAGSAGHVYTLTTAGHRLLAILDGAPQPPRTQPSRVPGALFLSHTLTVSGVYVDLIEYSRTSDVRVHTFITEPRCWHPLGNGASLRPDAYAVLRRGAMGGCWWLEIDAGTEIVPRLRAKIGVYQDFFVSGGVGPHGVPPRVVFTAPDQQRAAVIAGLLGDTGDMITATTHDNAAALLVAELPTR